MGNRSTRGLLLFDRETPARVAVLRALHLGDLLCAVPALRTLRSARPAAHVALVGLPWARDFAARFSAYVDEFVEFPGYPGLPERVPSPGSIPAFLQSMRTRRLDLAIQMQGDGSITNGLVALFGARRMAGFRLPSVPVPPGADLVAYPSRLSEPGRHLHLVRWLTGDEGSESLEFPIRPAEDQEWAGVRSAERLRPGGYACLHAGARDPRRRWPPARFAEVAAALSARGVPVVLTGDGPGECRITKEIAARCRVPVTDLAGRTSLGALAAAVRDARLLVSSDTGVSHLAAALRTPSVIVFRITDPARWAPADRRLHRVVWDGTGAVRDVLREADRLLSRDRAGTVVAASAVGTGAGGAR